MKTGYELKLAIQHLLDRRDKYINERTDKFIKFMKNDDYAAHDRLWNDYHIIAKQLDELLYVLEILGVEKNDRS